MVYIDVDDQCRLNMDQLKDAVNDETVPDLRQRLSTTRWGTIMPSPTAAAKGRALFHADAVRATEK